MNGSSKHSSLLWYGNNYCRKMFYRIGPRLTTLVREKRLTLLVSSKKKVLGINFKIRPVLSQQKNLIFLPPKISLFDKPTGSEWVTDNCLKITDPLHLPMNQTVR
jgi:hypothetical protein